jgi:hypothetical protein
MSLSASSGKKNFLMSAGRRATFAWISDNENAVRNSPIAA